MPSNLKMTRFCTNFGLLPLSVSLVGTTAACFDMIGMPGT